MEVPSGTELARLEIDNLVITLEIRGEVRVTFQGTEYKDVDDFPPTLLYKFHTGEAYEDPNIYIEDNNWAELFIWEKMGRIMTWTGFSEVTDLDGSNKEELYQSLKEMLEDYKKGV